MDRSDKPHKPGIYRIIWEDKSSSIASVGIDATGKNWIAPTNWSFPSVICTWGQIDHLELLATQSDVDLDLPKKTTPNITETVIERLTKIVDRAIDKDDLQTALQATNLLKDLYENMANKLFPNV